MDSMNNRSAAEEVAAAEAEVRAAQARLDAARARMASEQTASPQVEAQPQPGAYGAYAAPVAPQAGQPSQNACAQPYVQPGQAPAGVQPQQPYGTAQQQPPYTQPGQGAGAQPYVQPGQPPTGAQQPYGVQQPYAQPGAYRAPQNPYAQQCQQPYVAPTVGEKDHVAAGLLAIFLGWLGVHKFYLGYNTSGFIMLGVSVLGGIVTLSVAVWAIWVIAIVEGVFYLTKSQTEFEQMYVLNKREWF